MTIYRLIDEIVFPDPSEAEQGGLLAVGGDLRPERLLAAYAAGIFPWYNEPPPLWFSPDPRLVLQLDSLHISRSLRKTLKQRSLEVRVDTAFTAVIEQCSKVPRPGQDGTWIDAEMLEAYSRLHELGFAHSIEAWQGTELVGGLYGISLGAAFFGESMFSTKSDASKVALVHLVVLLKAWDFDFIDCQVHTPHLERMGAEEWPREQFLQALRRSLEAPTRQGSWTRDFSALQDSAWDWV